jgi:hypothetical protein
MWFHLTKSRLLSLAKTSCKEIPSTFHDFTLSIVFLFLHVKSFVPSDPTSTPTLTPKKLDFHHATQVRAFLSSRFFCPHVREQKTSTNGLSVSKMWDSTLPNIAKNATLTPHRNSNFGQHLRHP